MALALRLAYNGPRRMTFRKVDPPVRIVYGQIVHVTEEEIAALQEKEGKVFERAVNERVLLVLTGESESKIEKAAKHSIAEEVRTRKSEAPTQHWSTKKRSEETDLPMIEVGDTPDGDGPSKVGYEAMTAKVRAKRSAASAFDRAAKKAKDQPNTAAVMG